jgi:Zn finger protein HypA/HybF involved in hydrogenase expression
MLAIEIFNSLVRATQKNKELLKVLAQNLDLITSVLITVLHTADTWKDKKVKKSMLALNIFTKLAKNLVMSKSEKTHNASIAKNGSLIIKQIEAECEKDKSFSNLKGKIKEIQKIMEQS